MITTVLAVVGYSDSGKTKVASSLIKTLTEKGYRLAAVKHCPHGHEVDLADSDTDRLYKAGAVTVVASSPQRLTKFERVTADSALESIVSTIGDGIDLVIAEGFKSSTVPKVLVGNGASPTPIPDDLIAIVTDEPRTWDIPTYSTDELHKLADQIRSQFLEARPTGPSVSLVVDGVPVPLKDYPCDALSGILKGFVGALKWDPTQHTW